MDNIEIYKKRLESIFVYNGFYEAASNIYKITRNNNVRQLQDIIELWRAWDKEDKWFDYADKTSVRDWYKRSQTKSIIS